MTVRIFAAIALMFAVANPALAQIPRETVIGGEDEFNILLHCLPQDSEIDGWIGGIIPEATGRKNEARTYGTENLVEGRQFHDFGQSDERAIFELKAKNQTEEFLTLLFVTLKPLSDSENRFVGMLSSFHVGTSEKPGRVLTEVPLFCVVSSVNMTHVELEVLMRDPGEGAK